MEPMNWQRNLPSAIIQSQCKLVKTFYRYEQTNMWCEFTGWRTGKKVGIGGSSIDKRLMWSIHGLMGPFTRLPGLAPLGPFNRSCKLRNLSPVTRWQIFCPPGGGIRVSLMTKFSKFGHFVIWILEWTKICCSYGVLRHFINGNYVLSIERRLKAVHIACHLCLIPCWNTLLSVSNYVV